MKSSSATPHQEQTNNRFTAKFLIAALAALIATPALASHAAGGNKSSKAMPPGELYHEYCSVCHGDKGDGNSRARGSFIRPPRDFTAPDSKGMPRDFMINTVRDGKAGTAMVGWKTQLSEQQIEAVVDYIRTAFMGLGGKTPAVAAPAPATGGPGTSGIVAPAQRGEQVASDMSLPFPSGLKGDAAKGKPIYMNNCATCHGAKGDGQGPRAYFINPKPRNFVHPISRSAFNRPALYAAVSYGKQGTEMPAWNKVLDDQQIADVAEFVFKSFINPPAQEKKASSGK